MKNEKRLEEIIQGLKDGKTITNNYGVKFKLINGFICSDESNAGFETLIGGIGCYIDLEDNPRILEPASIKPVTCCKRVPEITKEKRGWIVKCSLCEARDYHCVTKERAIQSWNNFQEIYKPEVKAGDIRLAFNTEEKFLVLAIANYCCEVLRINGDPKHFYLDEIKKDTLHSRNTLSEGMRKFADIIEEN